ncbi:MAG: carboxypeptidase regulatory-like domain-containing protein [Bacteroidetes bacterium]|nr:carboxypeptidase regulatory-like domain-containing protein [Bacteroidota bacterium]
MQKRQIAKLNMYNRMVTLKTEVDNDPIFSSLPGFSTLWAQFMAGIPPIAETAQQQSIPITHAAADKIAKRLLMLDEATTIHLVVQAYAVTLLDNTLELEMEFPTSRISQTSESKTIEHCQLIHDKALDNAAQIAAPGYDVTIGMINSLQQRITDFKAVINAPIIADQAHAQLTATLPTMFKSQDAILAKLDKIAALLIRNHKSLHTLWVSARIHSNFAQSHPSLRGKIIDSQTRKGIPHAIIKILELNKTYKTGIKGNYKTAHLPEAYYTLQITAPGYHPHTQSTTIIAGKHIILNITLNHLV